MHFIMNLFFIVGFIVVVLGLSALFGLIFHIYLYDFKATHNKGFQSFNNSRRRNKRR